MVLKTLRILGFRGFEAHTIDFAVPNGKRGSGLTVITGANNTGKTAILECIRARAGYAEFHPGYRNSKIDEVHLHFTFEDGTEEIRSLRKSDSRIKHECHPIRTKKPRGPSAAVHGLLDEAFEVRPEYREQVIAIFTRVAEYVTKEPIAYS